MNLNLLHAFNIDPTYTYKICVKTKMTKLSFYLVERNMTPLVLIHSNSLDLKFI